MARTKISQQERLARRRLAKRERYAMLKENEELYALERQKNRIRYLQRKAEKKINSINELTPRAQRDRRRRWRINSKKYQQKKPSKKRLKIKFWTWKKIPPKYFKKFIFQIYNGKQG